MTQPPRKKRPETSVFLNYGSEEKAQPPRKRSELAKWSDVIQDMGHKERERKPLQQVVSYDGRRYIWVRLSDNRIMATWERPRGPEALHYYAELVPENIWQHEQESIKWLSKPGGPLHHRPKAKRLSEAVLGHLSEPPNYDKQAAHSQGPQQGLFDNHHFENTDFDTLRQRVSRFREEKVMAQPPRRKQRPIDEPELIDFDQIFDF